MLYKPKRGSNILVDLSPMIDVVFLLLIFFMVSTRFKDDQGMDLALPGSESRQATKGESLVILIDTNEKIRVAETDVGLPVLAEAIRGSLPDYETKTVVLKVDKNVNHGLVISVMDAAKKGGAEGVTFATTAKAKDGSQE